MSKVVFKDKIYKLLGKNRPKNYDNVVMGPKNHNLSKLACIFTLYDDGEMVFEGSDKTLEEHIRKELEEKNLTPPGTLPKYQGGKTSGGDYWYGFILVKPGDEKFLDALMDNLPEDYLPGVCFTNHIPVNSSEDVERVIREYQEQIKQAGDGND